MRAIEAALDTRSAYDSAEVERLFDTRVSLGLFATRAGLAEALAEARDNYVYIHSPSSVIRRANERLPVLISGEFAMSAQKHADEIKKRPSSPDDTQRIYNVDIAILCDANDAVLAGDYYVALSLLDTLDANNHIEQIRLLEQMATKSDIQEPMKTGITTRLSKELTSLAIQIASKPITPSERNHFLSLPEYQTYPVLREALDRVVVSEKPNRPQYATAA